MLIEEPKDVRARITHTLSLFPRVSPTMLQMGLGVQLKPDVWQPVFEKMLQEGIAVREIISLRSPAGRWKTYTFLSLKNPEPLSTYAMVSLNDDEGIGNYTQPE